MATITLRAQKGAPLTFAEIDNNWNAINQELVALGLAAALKGSIVNADIAADAGIADTKLAVITTPGKVANSATSAATANTGNAIVLRDANGNFSAGTITAALAGNASSATQFSGNRTITLTGAVTGNVSTNFSGNASLATTLAAGIVDNAAVAANAGIADSKLAAISTANKVAASAIDIDGAFDIGQALPDTALLLVDRTGAGENRKTSITRVPAYVFSKISGDVVINSSGVATVTPAGKVDATDVFAQISGDITISATGTASITANTIYNADINASAAIAHTKLASLLAGQVLMGNSSNIPTATAISGDISLSAAGVTSIAAGVIVNADIASDANIAFSKLAPLAAGQFLVGNGANVAQGVSINGDVTINGSGTATIRNDVSLAGAPTVATPDLTSNGTRIASTAFVVSRIAQDAPTKTGGGASGTWGINISGSSASCAGNASTATTLVSPRTINGTLFDGSAGITTSSWGAARTVTIGATARSVDGSGNVSWSLADIGGSTWGINISGNAGSVTNGVYTNTSQTITGIKTFNDLLRVTPTAPNLHTASIEIGAGRSASGYAVLNLIGDTTYSAFGLQLIRDNTGPNANSYIYHEGTGTLQLTTLKAAALALGTNLTNRLVLSSAGDIFLNSTTDALPGNGNTNTGAAFSQGGSLWISRASNAGLALNRNGDGNVAIFHKSGSALTGNGIEISGTQVNFVSSSDYRLKTLLGGVADALARVLRVPVYQYLRAAGGSVVHDGFLAHELQREAPYAVTGQRDAAASDGTPVYQGVDHGKIVPLLWAAVQQLAWRVEALAAAGGVDTL